MSRVLLGQDTSGTDFSLPMSLGPLPDLAIDPNLLLAGGAVLVFAFLLRGTSRRVSRYQSKRRSRVRRRKQLKQELSRL